MCFKSAVKRYGIVSKVKYYGIMSTANCIVMSTVDYFVFIVHLVFCKVVATAAGQPGNINE